ncbi:MAG: GNAT family N-acetyltransferase [Dehalococcoidia bacterium]
MAAGMTGPDTSPRVNVQPVAERDRGAFFAMLREYMAEMDRYDPATAESPYDVDRYIAAMLEDMEGREFLWLLLDGERAGMAIVRTLPDFPDDRRMVATIGEFYVAPAYRRRGVGGSAVQAILDDHRRRGTYEVEAGILRDNFLARAFWARMGFELRFYQTARRP